jgi:hypothetical protein
MIRFLVAVLLSIFFCYVGVVVFLALATYLIADWASSGFWSRIWTCLNLCAQLCIWGGLAVGSLYLFWAPHETDNRERLVRWVVLLAFALAVLVTIFTNPVHYVFFIMAIFAASYWVALKPIDFNSVKTRLLQFSGLSAAVLFILGIGVALFGFTNSPSNYSGRRLIELAAYGSGALNTLEREFAIASGAIVFGGILVAVAVALVVWLVASRRK